MTACSRESSPRVMMKLALSATLLATMALRAQQPPTQQQESTKVAPPKQGSAKASAKAPQKQSTTKKAHTRASVDTDSVRLAREDSILDARWPVKGPEPLPGSILPGKRIVAYYGNPLSKKMGVLGEYEPEDMLRRLDAEVAAWTKADPSTPVQPALHVIAVVAQAGPGKDGRYRLRMDSVLIEKVAGWAAKRNALVFLDVQVGLSTLREELPRLTPFLSRPHFHLGIDPEFSMKDGTPPGRKIGTFDAADVNYAVGFLADLVTKYSLPPKVFVVHRFTQQGVTHTKDIRLDPRVQIVMDMDGFGPPHLKKNTFRKWIKAEPVQFAGWKQFYKPRNDFPRTTIAEILRLKPGPLYIQYQ